MLAIGTLDPTIQGICFLVAVVVFVMSAVLARSELWASLVAIGLAFASFVFMWNAFGAA